VPNMRLSPPLVLACLLLGTAFGAARAADWGHWRGPARNGVTTHPSGWKGEKWPAGPELWTADLGIGSSSPLVVGGRVYGTGWRDGQDYVYGLDAATGRKVWEASYAAPQYGRHAIGDQGFFAGPTSTPEYDAATGFLYTLGADGDLHCWDTKAGGRKVWHVNLHDRFGVPQRPQATARGGTHRDYGYTSSPLVIGETLIVEVGASDGTLMGLDKHTGNRKWGSEYTGPAGHSGGPFPMEIEGLPCVGVLAMNHLVVARLDPGSEGKTVTTFEWITDFANNVPTPAVQGNHVVITTPHNMQQVVKVEITRAGAREIWRQRYFSRVCSPVIYNGHVYWVSRGLMCLDFETGELKWSGGRFGDTATCVVTGDGRVIVWANHGDLALVESADRSPDEYRELAQLSGLFEVEVWPHITVAEGRVYCKDRDGNLKCLAL
jgi:outer membrane protein assembly factor BamB